MKKYKPTIIKFFKIGMLVLLIVVLIFPSEVKYILFSSYNKLEYKINGPQSPDCRNCHQLFNDGVNIHRKAYTKEKINEQQTDKSLINLNKKGILKKIESNNNYTIRKLYHSKPLLLPKAVIFLDSLSNAYRQLCEKKSLSYIPFEITSVTRTVESVSKLTKTNNNAIEESAHLHGKTFDVSYRSFYNKNKQKEAFIEALSNLQKQKKCFVKFERNGCLHITAN
jgi:hypothetical protein